MSSAGRYLVLLVLALHWGGLTFYTGIVVPISHDVLLDPMEGGLITQQVTHWIQLLAVASVVCMLLNAVWCRDKTSRLRIVLFGCPLLLAICTVGQFLVHRNLDAVIVVAEREITDQESFDTNHRWYNQLTTVEWLTSLTYMATMVVAWTRQDSVRGQENKPST